VPDNIAAAVAAAATIAAAAAAVAAAAAAAGKPFVVLGFGSSSYLRFCAAADLMHTLLVSVGGVPLMPAAKADALAGEESVVWPWVQQLAIKMQGRGWLDGRGASDLIGRLPLNDQSAVSGAPSCSRSSARSGRSSRSVADHLDQFQIIQISGRSSGLVADHLSAVADHRLQSHIICQQSQIICQQLQIICQQSQIICQHICQ
jgi:hypothetical protein